MTSILLVSYFDIKCSVEAHTRLSKENELVEVDYICDTGEQLTSINESLNSSGSEEGSDGERKAKEALKTREEKLKQEYEALDDSSAMAASKTMKGIPANFAPSNYRTMPLPFTSGFPDPRAITNMNATMQLPISSFYSPLELTPNYSDCSFDNESLSEE